MVLHGKYRLRLNRTVFAYRYSDTRATVITNSLIPTTAAGVYKQFFHSCQVAIAVNPNDVAI